MSDNLNALEMSDEDFLNADITAFNASLEDSDEQTTDDVKNTNETAKEEEEEVDNEEEEEVNDEVDDETNDETDSTTPNNQEVNTNTEEQVPEEKPSVQPTGEMTDQQYIDIGKQIMSEFKANGSIIKMKSADDAIRLMQMGANYHKKMAGLKPSLKVLKLLENNGLLDSEKLNYLIDLHQKKPEAITQLLKDSKIDPMDIDVENETTYKPNNRTVNDTELILDEILESISGSAHYDRTLTVLGDDWDDQSRKIIAENPEIIRTINAHMENGVFDQVMQAVDYERRLGKLTGISDFEAYQRIGSYMHANNMFQASVNQQQVSQHNQPPVTQNALNQQQEAERKSRKKAASSSSQRPAAVSQEEYNPLAMSDEEFLKLNNFNY